MSDSLVPGADLDRFKRFVERLRADPTFEEAPHGWRSRGFWYHNEGCDCGLCDANGVVPPWKTWGPAGKGIRYEWHR